jgi:hypothetical protein
MNIKNILFPFNHSNEHLKEKWWHRLFVVAFVIFVLLGLAVSIGVIGEELGSRNFNSTVQTNLKDFTAAQDKSVSDATSLFLNKYSQIGCLEDSGKISYVSTYELKNQALCSADLSAHLSDVADKIISSENISANYKNELIGKLSQTLQEDTEKRYCFVPKNICASSGNIVAYKHGAIFYLQIAIYALVITYLLSLFLQLMYFKGLIYIIYGKKK